MTSQVWPTHAYVPGKTTRHPEGAFDAICNTAHEGLSPETLAQSAAFQTGLRYIHAGYFWEAHELLEPVWMALPNPSAERHFVQALIQIANGLLKLKMERPKAAMRLEAIARQLLEDAGQGHAFEKSESEVRRVLGSLKDAL